MKPDYLKNFCRVYELPKEYPEGFCFGGPKPVIFKMVDWFNPWPDDTDEKKYETWDQVKPMLLDFIKNKKYIKPDKKYLVVTDFDESFVFERRVL